ncbi:sensor with HAMP domain protein [Paenibacillus sp. BIHB 4019]|uniref:Sensor with HAMP domain protein n=1 Tax=Paenibacillus sp. BIHB 4019 TaxID=1870819 RepID=A0A1B2DCQ1_9BACL|nr:histidine kinase [Paenibacillus sp. BIHB 4019]ANY65477.1 sensor with HAMP domain protein [Paenibacillus sp. BIHB 4019]
MKSFQLSKLYIPFTYKMMIPYMALVLLTDVLVGYISYTMLIQSRTEMAETNIRTAMEQTRNNIEYQMDEIERISSTLFSSLTFQNALQNTGEPLEIMLKMKDDIIPQMRAPLQLYGNNIRLAVYTVDEKMYEVPGDDMDKPIQRRDYYVLSVHQIENTDWFKSLQASNQDNLWMQLDSDRKLDNISHFRKLVSSSGMASIIGYVRVTARFDELLGNFDTFPIDEGISMRFLNTQSGEVMYTRGITGDQSNSASYLSVKEEIPGTPFIIETIVPHAYLNKDASRMQKVIFAVCLISFLVMVFIGYIVARLSGKKMKRIVTLVRSFQEGNFHKRIGFTGNDEFVHIANSFNQMATSIQELIKNVYVQGIQKKQAELDVLQAQISPHFLYNTLSTIGSLANLGETDKVTAMVQGLSKFYRLTLNGGNVYITLEKELEQVKTYLDIQRVKYADTFEVYYDVEPDILQTPIIKLILQPFVENIFKHAWFGKTIAIRITGRRLGDRIELKIIDTGIGMRPDTLRKMLSNTALLMPAHAGPTDSAEEGQSDKYGLKNVEERIKLRYGTDFGIRIGSHYGAGTTVQIILPVENAEMREDAEGLRP